MQENNNQSMGLLNPYFQQNQQIPDNQRFGPLLM